MPTAPRPRCTTSGCPERVDRPGPCQRHRSRSSRHQRARGRSEAWRWVYNDRRWKDLRARVLFEEPECRCGCGRPSTVVDHITPHRGDPDLAFDRANCQGMAKPCHDAKTARELELGGAHQ